MANNLNLCQFIGNLGNDVESRFLQDGSAVASFILACNWKGKSSEGTEWIRITAFGKLAEICGQYLNKGSKVYVSGRMRTRSYDKDGVKTYVTEVVADRMEMLGGKQDGQQQSQQAQQRPAQQRAPAATDWDEDLPF